jgi:hypothetical protein
MVESVRWLTRILKRRPKPCVKLITPDGTETSTSTLTRTCWGYQLNMTAKEDNRRNKKRNKQL